jgi:hypothetical protein
MYSSVVNIEDVIDANKAVGIKVNAEKTKDMLLSRHQDAGQNHYMKTADRFFENDGSSDVGKRQ